ncbi:MAG TPA: hypothetical protein VFX98_10200 [Longimicrobiaceae bacterium]|nr:hypothetical protein [Longimicrobiaceae bacterium]
MEISSLTLRVLLLFFPGVLCAMLVDSLTVHRGRTPVQFLTHAFVLGMGSYLSLAMARATCAAIADVLGLPPPLEMHFFAALADEQQSIAWGEIALTAAMAVPLGATVAAALNHRIFHRAAKGLRITRRSGDVDVWGSVFNVPSIGWVRVRDLEYDLNYYGWADAFSDTGDKPELLLSQVDVRRTSTGDRLYEAERVYFARPSERILIELVTNVEAGTHDAQASVGAAIDPG